MANEDFPTEYSPQVTPDDKAVQAVHEQRRRAIDILTGRGDTKTVLANTLMGFNHRMAPTVVPKNRERNGYVFFTRPDLDLGTQNTKVSRRLTELAEAPMNSAERAVLAMLDPLNDLTALTQSGGKLGMPCHPMVPFDNRQAFLPLLSNRLLNLSGFPDNTLDVYTSNEGLKREQIIMADSHYGANYNISLSASFQNVDGDMLTMLFTVWLEAISGYLDGTFIPRMRNIIQHEINYETRIYRLIMDPTNRYVSKIGGTIAAFPVNDLMGAILNYDRNVPIMEGSDVLNVQFQAVGTAVHDPIWITEFNRTVAMFNPDMTPVNPDDPYFTPRASDRLVRVPYEDLNLCNYYGYPQIERATKELLWFVYSDDYERLKSEKR